MGNQGKYRAVHRPECIMSARGLLYGIMLQNNRAKPNNYVTEEGARTLDHKVKSLALYQLSYSGPACIARPWVCPRLNWVRVTGC